MINIELIEKEMEKLITFDGRLCVDYSDSYKVAKYIRDMINFVRSKEMKPC